MHRVKIYGAGSVGNHLAHAARSMGWSVTVCDVAREALERMRAEIYPGRYGGWDPAIRLCLNAEAPRGGFDVIFIGTPPDQHLGLAFEALEERPRALVIEKPLCPPSLDGADRLYRAVERAGVPAFVGYNHVVGAAAQRVETLLSEEAIGRVETIDVEFREHWQGIFVAHPWLKGPEDTYLGYWQRGGGASGEHSHATNLWQHFARCVGAGRVTEVTATLTYATVGAASYDSLCFLTLRTETGLVGRVVQDVVSLPARKRARVQGARGAIEWVCSHCGRGDAVIVTGTDGAERVEEFPKRRPDDFIMEMRHLDERLNGTASAPSGMGLQYGLDTMLVLAAAHRSEAEARRMRIDYAQAYAPTAIV